MSSPTSPDRREASGDQGLPDARLAAALVALAARAQPPPTGRAGQDAPPEADRAPGEHSEPAPAVRAEVLAALRDARVFAAVSVRTGPPPAASTPGRPGHGSGADMVLLSLVGSDGGRAVPLFLDADAVVAFRPGARPVALTGTQACAAAVQDGAVAVLLDPAGAALALSGTELVEMAAGRVPIPGAGLSSRWSDQELRTPQDVDPTFVRRIAEALEPESLRAARLLEGPDGLVLGLVPAEPLDPARLAALVGRLLGRLASHLPPDGLDVAVVADPGPGLRLPVRRPRGRPARRGRRRRSPG